MRHRYQRAATCALLLAGVMGDSSAGLIITPPQIRTVGGDAQCDFAELSGALLVANSGDTIRIARNKTYEDTNVAIVDQSMTLAGGFPDCSAEEPEGPVTQIRGAAGADDPVIGLVGTGTPRRVVLRNLWLTGGSRGGLSVIGSVTAVADELTVLGNRSADDGGGIVLVFDASLRVEGPLSVTLNETDQRGGGLLCADSALTVVDELFVSGNDALGFGGGLMLQNCQMTTEAGSRISMTSNDAAAGGGLWAANSQLMWLDTEVTVALNTAIGSGGGLLLGVDSELEHRGTLSLRSNEAAQGGGLSVLSGAQVELRGARGCPEALPGTRSCGVISGNRASRGGAFLVVDGRLRVFNQRIRRNDASSPPAAIGAVGSVLNDGRLDVWHSVIDANGGGDALIDVQSGSQLDLFFATVVANDTPPSFGLDHAVFRLDGAGTTMRSHGVVLWRNLPASPSARDFISTNGASSEHVCEVRGDTAAIAPLVSGADFINPDAELPLLPDLRLTPTARLVDRCDLNLILSSDSLFDVQGNARPADVPSVINVDGAWDVGAYEYQPLQVFANGFEPLD